MLESAIGIDLGTSSSCVSVFENGKVTVIANDFGNNVTPSYVAFSEKQLLVGDAAKNQLIRNPYNTIFDFKRLLGRSFEDVIVENNTKYWPFEVIKDNNKLMLWIEYIGETKKISPEEAFSYLLTKIKETAETYLGKRVSNAVISVPVSFNYSQRLAIINAANMAGINVLRLINEPSAAALAYTLSLTNNREHNILIFNMGAGSLDTSIVTFADQILEVKSTVGNINLGGRDFDNCLVNYFIQEFQNLYHKNLTINKKALQRLRIECETVKKNLSSTLKSYIEIDALMDGISFCTSLSRQKFEELNEHLFVEIIKVVEAALDRAKIQKNQISEIILVGGSSRIPKVQQLLEEFFNGKKLNRSVNQDEGIAIGAAILSAILQRSTRAPNILLLDVTTFSLGIKLSDNAMDVLIQKNTVLPFKQTRHISTVSRNQQSILLSIFDGNQPLADQNICLGELMLHKILPMEPGNPLILITFDLDSCGILNVTVNDEGTGNSKTVRFNGNKIPLSRFDIEQIKYHADSGNSVNINIRLTEPKKYNHAIHDTNDTEIYLNQSRKDDDCWCL